MMNAKKRTFNMAIKRAGASPYIKTLEGFTSERQARNEARRIYDALALKDKLLTSFTCYEVGQPSNPWRS